MKIFLGCVALLLGLSIGAKADDATERLVRACNTVMLWDAGVDRFAEGVKEITTVRQKHALAQRYLHSYSSSGLKKRLLAAQKLPLSAGAAQSVAYVAATHGIRPYENVRLIHRLSFDSPNKPLFPQMRRLGYQLYTNMESIYERSGDTRIARLLLKEDDDGEGGVVMCGVHLRMITKQPRLILGLAMQSKKAFRNLSGDLSQEGGEEEFRVLRRLCHDRDPILRSGARQILHRVHADRSHRH